MIIYHGSKKVVEEPLYKGSDHANDYGPAFYMTVDLDAAKMWACRNDSLGIVNKYHVDTKSFEKLKILDLTEKSKYSVLNWLAILMHFRILNDSFVKKNKSTLKWLEKYYIDVDKYDVVIGFRADDAYFRFPTLFVSNDLAFEDLEEIFLSGNLGVQYAFISEKAIKLLKHVAIIECEDSFIGQYFSIVSKASNAFAILLNKERDINKTYILDLMRKDHE